ncbi:TPA: lipopolysaccharide biosynthesis protein [Citrobacter farmeri]|uniref:lipopolysaccharide biosynthesis protein n=1 Tax=Citrobacter farmeri TaxID=67824 RepID=UPI00388F93FF|nr:lipopolysaccharide biosynthesis protein [Citrobacter farmeri]
MTVYFINWKADYELKMIDYLHQHYQVVNLPVPSSYVWIAKKLRKLGVNTDWLGKSFIRKYVKNLKSDDIALFNDSVITKGITPQIIKNLRCKKVLLLRNSVNETFIEKHSGSFDLIYDFEDKKNCSGKIKRLEQFFPVGLNEIPHLLEEEKKNEKKVCYFLGKDKNRLKTLVTLARKLTSYDVVLDFNVVRDNTTDECSDYLIHRPLSYKENLKRSLACDIIVDITQENQSGWTLRILEALYFNKKIITNNQSILNSEIYSKERFFILNTNEWGEFDDFINAPNTPVSHDILYNYSPEHMLESIMRECEKNDF